MSNLNNSCINIPGTTNGSLLKTPAAIVGAISQVVAVLYNYYDPALVNSNLSGLSTSGQNRVILNSYSLMPDTDSDGIISMEKFLDLFFATSSGYFNVNPANVKSYATILSAQTFSSNNSSDNKFSLYQYILRAYCSTRGLNINDIDPRLLIRLQKEVARCDSLVGIHGTCIALSWDEVISVLIGSGIIVLGVVNTNYAVVPLQIVLNFHSFTLDIDLKVVFTYNVRLNGYIKKTNPAQPE